MSGNGNDRIEELKSLERKARQELNIALSELDAARRRADKLRKQLQDHEAERLLLERKVVKVKILPDPRIARKNLNASDEAIKRLFTNMTQAEREDLLAELRGETVE